MGFLIDKNKKYYLTDSDLYKLNERDLENIN